MNQPIIETVPCDLFDDYAEDAIKTLSHEFHLTFAPEALHGAIGIVTEVGEMVEAVQKALISNKIDIVNMQEEIGDCLWYVAVASRYSNDDIKDVFSNIVEEVTKLDMHNKDMQTIMAFVMDLQKDSAAYLDLFKKGLYYNKPIDVDIQYKILIDISCGLVGLSFALGLIVADIMDTNIAKLKARFPDAFNSDDANNRDLNKEREVLEGKQEDDLYQEAVRVVTQDKKATTSYVQRTLKIGYNKAAHLLQLMEEKGIVSAADHNGKRVVVIRGVSNDS